MNVRRFGCALLVLGLLPALPAAPAQFDFLKNVGGSVKKIAYFKIDGPVTETPVEMPPLFGGDVPTSMKSLLSHLKEARQDANVSAVVLNIENASLGLAQIEELHSAISQFAAVDKDVFVHADMLTMGTYLLASAASHVSLTPTGDLWVTGIYGETPYLKGTLDKMGLFADMEQCGSHKSAGEIFTRTGPSPEAEAMNNWLLDSVYDTIVKRIAQGRKLPPEKVRQLIDEGPYSAERALKAGLVDSVQHRQDFVASLQERYGEETQIDFSYADEMAMEIPEDPFGFMTFVMQLMNPQPKQYTEPSVAIVYVEGPIVTGTAEVSPFGSSEGAYSTTIRKALDTAAEDDSVKAVVLRVDSPGGSALASETILDASRRVAAKKPLIVSMGNVAGSGGYYVTCGAHTVFADASTITASIGVIAGKIVTTGGWDKIGVSWHANSRGKMSGMLATDDGFTDEERAKLRQYMEEIYEVFKGHVTKARGEKLTKPLEEMAGGRVYTGAQALELGLVDRIGGLDDALKFAADQANLGTFDIRVIPEPPSIFDLFMGGAGEEEYIHMSLRPGEGLLQNQVLEAALPAVSVMDPQRVRLVWQALTRLELVRREGVIMMTPQDWLIR